MKKIAVAVSVLALCACQPDTADASQNVTSHDAVSEAAPVVTAQSEVQWDGKNAGHLRFTTASCIVMNGEVINFYAPAKAKDNIGDEPVLPQINGSKAGTGWALNVMVSEDVTHSGSGEASAATARMLKVNGKLLDGASMQKGSVETVGAAFTIACTDVDDLGTL